MERNFCSAATVGQGFWASDSSKSVWRCKLEGSTKSGHDFAVDHAGADQKMAAAAPMAPTMMTRGRRRQPLLASGPIPEKHLARIFLLERIFHDNAAPAAQEAPT